MKRTKKFSGEGWSFISAASEVKQKLSAFPEQQIIKVTIEKRNKGKVVTKASGFSLSVEDIKALGKELKKRTGTGGSVGTAAVEVQGEHLEQVKAYLVEKGYRVK